MSCLSHFLMLQYEHQGRMCTAVHLQEWHSSQHILCTHAKEGTFLSCLSVSLACSWADGLLSGSSTEAFPSPFSFFVMRFSLLFVVACALHQEDPVYQRCMQCFTDFRAYIGPARNHSRTASRQYTCVAYTREVHRPC